MKDVRSQLAELGLELPDPFGGAGSYVPSVRTGDLLVTAGHIPLGADGTLHLGKVGRDLTTADALVAARAAATSLLATLDHELGPDEDVARIVRVGGYVNCTDDYIEHTTVLDAASDVLVACFGERGEHARLAVGVNSLPVGMALEIEATIEIETTATA